MQGLQAHVTKRAAADHRKDQSVNRDSLIQCFGLQKALTAESKPVLETRISYGSRGVSGGCIWCGGPTTCLVTPFTYLAIVRPDRCNAGSP